MRLCDNAEAVAQQAANTVIQAASAAIAERGVFHWVLAGGTTPKRCYELLIDAEIDWSRVHVWFGDERCLPAGDAERNDHMAELTLLDHVAVPDLQIHHIAAELGPELAAEAYHTLLTEAPVMDLVLLGMGEDGHTASLFPHNPALSDSRLAVPVYDAPKPPSERVSMGYAVLNAARRSLVLVAGTGKRDAFALIKAGEKLPVTDVADAEYLIDRKTVIEG